MTNTSWKTLDNEELLKLNGGDRPWHADLAKYFRKLYEKIFR